MYSAATGETRVDTEIHLLVKVAFFTVFAFSHRSTETWRGGRLTSLTSETVEQGETLHVEGAATPQGFRVVSKGGPFIASAATLTSNSLWTPAVPASSIRAGGGVVPPTRKSGQEAILIPAASASRTRWETLEAFIFLMMRAR